MSQRVSRALLVVLAVALAPDAGASPGADWLAANQNASGSWGTAWFSAFKPTPEFRDTAEALKALQQSGESSGSAYANGTAWLAPAEAGSVDYLSRRIIALSDTANDLSIDFAALQDAHNLVLGTGLPGAPGGGWGTAKGHASNAADTATALRAIDAQGLGFGWQLIDVVVPSGGGLAYGFQVPTDATHIRVEFFALTTPVRVRLAEGGVPPLTDPYVDVFTPSVVVYPDQMPFTPGVNFVRFNVGAPSTIRVVISWENPTFDTRVIARAMDFLRASQNPDGGFGLRPGSTSTLATTVNVLTALGQFGVGYNTDAEEVAGGAYLAAFQGGTGAVGHVPGSPTAAETAAAKIAFGAIGMTTEENLARASLVSMQDPSGHWDGDPHTTALAVQALTLVPEPASSVSLLSGILLLRQLARSRRSKSLRVVSTTKHAGRQRRAVE